MNPKMIWANYTVSDLDRTNSFYEQLGFTSNGKSSDLTSFIFGENGLIIHFFKKEVLQSNVDINISDATSGNEIIFTLSARTKDEVNQWEKEVIAAGGTIISKPEEFGAGYYGFVFADPDGHKFNVFYM